MSRLEAHQKHVIENEDTADPAADEKPSGLCAWQGCQRMQIAPDGLFCRMHECRQINCREAVMPGETDGPSCPTGPRLFCAEHLGVVVAHYVGQWLRG